MHHVHRVAVGERVQDLLEDPRSDLLREILILYDQLKKLTSRAQSISQMYSIILKRLILTL